MNRKKMKKVTTYDLFDEQAPDAGPVSGLLPDAATPTEVTDVAANPVETTTPAQMDLAQADLPDAPSEIEEPTPVEPAVAPESVDVPSDSEAPVDEATVPMELKAVSTLIEADQPDEAPIVPVAAAGEPELEPQADDSAESITPESTTAVNPDPVKVSLPGILTENTSIARIDAGSNTPSADRTGTTEAADSAPELQRPTGQTEWPTGEHVSPTEIEAPARAVRAVSQAMHESRKAAQGQNAAPVATGDAEREINPTVALVAAPQTCHAKSIDAWLERHPEFPARAQKLARLYGRERRDALAFGALAEHTLRRYDRELNPAKLAQALTTLSGANITRETINLYRDGYRMYRLWKSKCGNRLPHHLEISKLAKAWGSGKGHLSDDERVKLCERTAEKGLSRAQMKDEIQRISREKTRAALTYDVVPQVDHVQQMDGLELLRSLEPESVDVLIMDWMYQDYTGGDCKLPAVHVPENPVSHLIECIGAARRVLKPYGAIALFSDHRSDPDRNILEALETAGLTRKDQYVFQKVAGSYSNLDGAPFANAHEIIDIYRRADVSGFPRHLRYQSSVSPKWHCRSHRSSAEREVHPFEKPIELMKTLIGLITVNGLVVDPFAGSGSSGVAALEQGCSYRGAELVSEYVEIANRRIGLAADREAETIQAINVALTGADAQQQAAIVLHLEQAGIALNTFMEKAA